MIISHARGLASWLDAKELEDKYGKKGSALLALPRLWTPPFVLLGADEVAAVSLGQTLQDTLDCDQLQNILNLAPDRQRIILRSSVIGESIWDRGRYASEILPPDLGTQLQSLDAAAARIVASAGNKYTGLLAQRYIEPAYQGEFGNLLRVSKTRDHWEISVVNRTGKRVPIRTNAQRDEPADTSRRLELRSFARARRLFGSLGAWVNQILLSGSGRRVTTEWVFDGRHCYLVQIDEEDEDISGYDPYQQRVRPRIEPAQKGGAFFELADAASIREWNKVRVLDELWGHGEASRPALFVAEVSELMSYGGGDLRGALQKDFETILGQRGVVVRTSARAGSRVSVNLPRSEDVSSEEAAEWCVNALSQLEVGPSEHDLAFVAHGFIGASASAWVRVEPNDPTVEIHALWGLPDALQFCPYDRWEVHLPTGWITSYPNYKSSMLISTADGGWEYVRVKNEIARHNCISEADAKELAMRSEVIADRLGIGCHVMWFLGCLDGKGGRYNMPWYWTETHGVEVNQDRLTYDALVVEDIKDVEALQKGVEPGPRRAIEFRPRCLE